MTRPRPRILLEYVNPHSRKAEQVLEADGVYALYYDGNPVSVRTVNTMTVDPTPKYKKCAFPATGHALRMARNLNELFRTDKFEVYKLAPAEKIS